METYGKKLPAAVIIKFDDSTIGLRIIRDGSCVAISPAMQRRNISVFDGFVIDIMEIK